MGVVNFLANIMPTVTVPKLDPVVGSFLKTLNGGIGNICLTMIVFTLILKLITFPLDFISRKTAKINQLIQERLKPQLDKIDKQCGDDKRLAQQKKTMLLRKSGQKMVGACLPALVTMALMIYVFTAVNSFTTVTMAQNYNIMAEQYSNIVLNEDGKYGECYDEINHCLTPDGEKVMIEKYESLTPRFLWIKNPYRPDAWQSAVSSYNDFKSGTIGVTALKIEDEFAEIQYEQIMGSIRASDQYKGWNGLMILPILAAAVSFLAQLIMSKTQPQPQASGQSAGTMKMMKYIFPLITLYFAFMYTSGFAIYLLFSSLFSLASTFLIGMFVNKMAERKEEEFHGQQSYRRK